MNTLRIMNAVKRYPNGAEAVKGVCVDVAEGELVVFVGPSGCGKSTLLPPRRGDAGDAPGKRAAVGRPRRHRVEISVVEELGAQRLVHRQLGPHDLSIARNAGEPVPSGTIGLEFRTEDLHLFHPESGRRL